MLNTPQGSNIHPDAFGHVKKLSLINAVNASAMTQTALKSAPKPSARNIPSKATIPPPAETATMAARAATAPTTVNHCRKARSRGKNMSLHSKPMAVTKERQLRQKGRKIFQQRQGRKWRYGNGCHDSSYGVALVQPGAICRWAVPCLRPWARAATMYT